MTEEIITILTVNYNTSDFIELMLYALKKLTRNLYKVIICDNGSTSKHIKKLQYIAGKYDNTQVIYREQSSFGSIGHAEAMDLLVSKVDTKYFVTMDSDAVLLMKNWDELLISKMSDKVKAVGTPTLSDVKPKDFPLVFSVMYETDIFKRIGPSFLPGNDGDISKDTGWELREKFHENGFYGVVAEVRNTKKYKESPFKSIYCAVYYFEEKIFCSHFGRGSSLGLAKYSDKWYFRLPKISRIIRILRGIIDKRRWISASLSIINNSSK